MVYKLMLCCLSATTIKNACFTLWAATNSFSASFCELRHRGSSLWQILVVVVSVGPCPVRFLLVSLLDGEAHIWLGDLRFALCGLGLLFLLCCDLPTYMSTGVHVDVILTCFFSCKDPSLRALSATPERKKNEAGFCCTRAPREEQERLWTAPVPLAAVLPSLWHRPAILHFCKQPATKPETGRGSQTNSVGVRSKNLPKRTIWEDGCT